MKKFKYRLQALLKVKEHIERERQKEHATALQKVHHQSNELDRLDRSRDSSLSQQRGQMKENLLVAEMLIYSRYLARLKRERLAGTELLKALEEEKEKKRTDLVEAAKERRVLEKLKERQLAKHTAEVEQVLTKEGDEIAVTCYRRKTQL
ncbi:MAG: flagellar export protein FliJ [candidate division Zixibacteria bacterium]|nr:flagellar export protein FliJ [candidate division Zixibacteria bacterium]